MSKRFLVDTSVWVEALRPAGRPNIVGWLKEALLRESVVLAPPIRTEILIGARDEKQFAELNELLSALPLLEDRPAVWERAAALGFRLRQRGLTVPLVDLVIASWAVSHSCVLAHRDRHYELIAGEVLEGEFLNLEKG